MINVHQHGLDRSLVINLNEMFEEFKVDVKYDGYKMPKERPLILIEQMPSSLSIITKGRESVETLYRYQIGLFDNNSVNLSINQERLQDAFIFNKYNYYDSLNDFRKCGIFDVELTSVTPISSGDITVESENNRVYFDIVIQAIKRRMI